MTAPPPDPRRPDGTNGWAIAAFVLGVLGGTILSVIFAIVALFQTKDRRQRGRGLAIAALVISAGWIAIITSLIAYGVSAGRERRGRRPQHRRLRQGCLRGAASHVGEASALRPATLRRSVRSPDAPGGNELPG